MFGFFDQYFLFFGLKITYYGFIIACAMGLGVFVACKNAKLRGLKSDDLLIVACYVLPLAVLGARAYYCIFSEQSYSFVEFWKIWDGGLAVYGGVIGGAIGVTLYCLIHKKHFLDVGDVVVPSLLLGQAIGRIGCYFAGCCYGIEVTNPSHQWFPLSVEIGGHWHYSTFFYESLWNLLGFVVLILLLRVFKVKQRGAVSASYLIIYGVGRAWIEALRGDSLYIGPIKVSQLLSIILIVVGLAILLFYFLKKSRAPRMGKGVEVRDISLDEKATKFKPRKEKKFEQEDSLSKANKTKKE